MSTQEIRQNKATRQWVVFSPARNQKPKEFEEPSPASEEEAPAHDDACPFCPGNQDFSSDLLFEHIDSASGRWQTRAIINKFPALAPEGGLERREAGIYLHMNGYGRHEVIIESPVHNQQMATMDPDQVALVVDTYHRRYLENKREHPNLMTLVFRNHGRQAGTSLVHPHSQLILTSVLPNHTRWREYEAQRYFDQQGRCVYCDILEFESLERRRVVYENEHFLGFVPYAAEESFQVQIMPKIHRADFGDITEAEKTDLAEALKNILSRLYQKLDDPDYNYIINTAARSGTDDPRLHWFLDIRPRLISPAGFQIGSGICINPSFPEADADTLNGSGDD
ncbi:MAG: galactose-1-phosphate uridylyltransferase [Thermodesulfobacteriota bacterium]